MQNTELTPPPNVSKLPNLSEKSRTPANITFNRSNTQYFTFRQPKYLHKIAFISKNGH